MAYVRLSVEGKRGCGYRKGGGLYLVAPRPSAPCGKLPIPLEVCPTCGEGFPYSRSPRWVDTMKLKAMVKDEECRLVNQPAPLDQPPGLATHAFCAMRETVQTGRGVLLWIGKQHYKTTEDFLKEAEAMGLSRRVKAVPRGFVVGETWVLLAHVAAIRSTCEECAGSGYIHFQEEVTDAAGESKVLDCKEQCSDCKGSGEVGSPGWFAFFRPTAVEYVVTGEETEEELEELEEKGYDLVQVVRKGENGNLKFEEVSDEEGTEAGGEGEAEEGDVDG